MKLKEYIIENVENIKKYYTCSKWGYFTCQHNGYEKDEVPLMRAIYKDDGYKILSNQKTLTRKNIKKVYTELHFIK
jgi:hypothetical protein